jgi:hypothetical protein
MAFIGNLSRGTAGAGGLCAEVDGIIGLFNIVNIFAFGFVNASGV